MVGCVEKHHEHPCKLFWDLEDLGSIIPPAWTSSVSIERIELTHHTRTSPSQGIEY